MTSTLPQPTTHSTYVTKLNFVFRTLLISAEHLFGERDRSWGFLGIEFVEGNPRILHYHNKQITIGLTYNCAGSDPDNWALKFELAHEICHLITPLEGRNSNLLEEGLATWFSVMICNGMVHPKGITAVQHISGTKYEQPFLLVSKLMNQDIDAIKKIRYIQPTISLVTYEELSSLKFNLTEDEIRELVQKF